MTKTNNQFENVECWWCPNVKKHRSCSVLHKLQTRKQRLADTQIKNLTVVKARWDKGMTYFLKVSEGQRRLDLGMSPQLEGNGSDDSLLLFIKCEGVVKNHPHTFANSCWLLRVEWKSGGPKRLLETKFFFFYSSFSFRRCCCHDDNFNQGSPARTSKGLWLSFSGGDAVDNHLQILWAYKGKRVLDREWTFGAVTCEGSWWWWELTQADRKNSFPLNVN